MKLLHNIDKVYLLMGLGLLSGEGFSSELFPLSVNLSVDTLPRSVEIFFRFDRSVLERDYMGNAESLAHLEWLLSPHRSDRMDSIKIEAYASPDGNAEYNRKLSQRRGAEVKKVLLWKFPHLESSRINYRGQGENWDGLRRRVLSDPHVPQRASVLDILSRHTSPSQREKQLRALNGGEAYHYLFNRHFPYLRSGSSVFITLVPKGFINNNRPDTLKLADSLFVSRRLPDTLHWTPQEQWRYYRPVAIKSNLLFDALSVLNIELEFPIAKRFSLLAEWTFPWWGGLKYPNDYTVQLLSGSLEGRYWFPPSQRMLQRNGRWPGSNPLTGWFVGVYGGAGLYDLQLGKEGWQGEFALSAGITAGFAHPIGRHLHLEYSLGVGYFESQYRSYTQIDDHKVWQLDARQSWLGPTKAKVSLVWIPQFKIKNR